VPDKARCLGGGNSDTNPCDAGSINISNERKHRINDSRDIS
jgi:hypothetical protein